MHMVGGRVVELGVDEALPHVLNKRLDLVVLQAQQLALDLRAMHRNSSVCENRGGGRQKIKKKKQGLHRKLFGQCDVSCSSLTAAVHTRGHCGFHVNTSRVWKYGRVRQPHTVKRFQRTVPRSMGRATILR